MQSLFSQFRCILNNFERGNAPPQQCKERHHGVIFDAGSLEAAAAWAARHLPERRLPDKAPTYCQMFSEPVDTC